MPTQKTRQEIIDKLSQCGSLSYKDMVDLLYSIFFLSDEIDPDVFLSRLTGRWSQPVANKGKYDTDFFVSYNEKIYRSTINNNVSIPGSSPTWIVQSDQVTTSFGFKGNAATDTNPGVPTVPEFWIGTPGTYPNFGNKVITGASGFLIFMNGSWSVANINIDLTQYKKKTDPQYPIYQTPAAANLGIPFGVVNGINGRDGSVVLIGTPGNYSEYWWTGGLTDSELVEKGKNYPFLYDQNISVSDLEVGAINTTGANIVFPTGSRTKYLPIAPGMQMDFTTRNASASTVFFYDANKVFISKTGDIGSTVTTISQTAYAPANAAFVRVQTINSTHASYVPFTFAVRIYGALSKIGAIQTWIIGANKKGDQRFLNGIIYEAQRDTISTEEPGVVDVSVWKPLSKDPLIYGYALASSDMQVGFFNSSGANFALATYNRSINHIKVKTGDVIDYNLRGVGNSFVFYYNESKVYVSKTVVIGSAASTVSGTLVIPSGVSYVRVGTMNETNADYSPYTFLFRIRGLIDGKSSKVETFDPLKNYTKGSQAIYNDNIYEANVDIDSELKRYPDRYYPSWKNITKGPIVIERASEALFDPYFELGVGTLIQSGYGPAPENYTPRVMKWKDGETRFGMTWLTQFAQYDVNLNYIAGTFVQPGTTENARFYDKHPNAVYFGVSTYLSKRFEARATFVDAGTNELRTRVAFALAAVKTVAGTPIALGSGTGSSDTSVAFQQTIAGLAKSYMGDKDRYNRFNFLYFSDAHFNTATAERNMDELIAFSKNPLIAESLDAVISGGDNSNGSAGAGYSKNKILTELATYISKMLLIQVPAYSTIGNHDDNINYGGTSYLTEEGAFAKALSKAEQYTNIIQPLASKWNNTIIQPNKTYYYADFSDRKIRLITLDCFDIPLAEGVNGKIKYALGQPGYYSQGQIDWLNTTLQSTPADYAVIISNHVAFDTADYTALNYLQGTEFIPSIINAWKNGSSYVHNYANATYPELNTSKSFSFTGNKEFVCYLCGHAHRFELLKQPTFPDQNTLMVPCLKTSDPGNFVRGEQDEIRNSFMIISVDRINKQIILTMFGAFRDPDGKYKNRQTFIKY